MSASGRLVSVGIPTYNRVDRLRTAVESVLGQDHPEVEVVISDNASTDGTEEYARGLVDRHPGRVRYLRNDENLGPTENFNLVRAACLGDFVMWLGDDDWLDPHYVSACVALLEDRPDAAMAAGVVRYVDGDRDLGLGDALVCDAAEPADRLLSYYRQVGDNGSFYGVTRAAVATRLAPMARVMGNDWYLMAAISYLGPILRVEQVEIRRSTGGATRSLKQVARSGGLTWIEGEIPQLVIAWLAFREIAWSSPVYADRSRRRRLALGAHVSLVVARRFVIPSIPKYLRLMSRRIRRQPALR